MKEIAASRVKARAFANGPKSRASVVRTIAPLYHESHIMRRQDPPSLLTRALCSLVMLALTASACSDDEASSAAWQPSEQDASTGQPDESDAGVDGADMAPTPPPEIEAPRRVVSVDTRLSIASVAAGDTVAITCEALDEEGIPLPPEALPEGVSYRYAVTPEESIESEGMNQWRALRTGQVTITCSSHELGLVDEQPALLEIAPGAPHTVTTTLSRRSVVAGESVQVTCQTFDAYGNPIERAVETVAVDPMGDDMVLSGNDVVIERAGDYTVSCQVAGAAEERPVDLEVVPGLPTTLVVGKSPDQQVYGLGQLITIETIVTDRYDNVIEGAPLSFASAPAGTSFGSGRYRYDQEGLYVATARVEGMTHNDVALQGDVEILVNGTGPSIDCVGPEDGAMVDAAPGSMVNFQGKLADTFGVDKVFVNGVEVTASADGNFSAPVTTRYGINFVDVTARDTFGEENSRTCAFLVSEVWAPEGSVTSDAVSLKLRQDAIDDRASAGAIDSLNDVLVRVLNSTALRDTIHTSLLASNPLYDNCLANTFLGCATSAKVTYLDVDYGGPHTTGLTLIDDGLGLRARINDLSVNMRVQGKVTAIPYNTTGWVDIEYIEVDLASNLLVAAGRPKITLRPNSVTTTVGSVNLRFGGLAGVIIDALEFFFKNTLRDQLASLVSGYVKTEFNRVLDAVFSNLDVSSLGSSVSVPRLDHGAPIPLSFNLSFSSLGVTPARALFGMGLGFSAPIARTGTTLGAPRPTGQILDDPSITGSVGVSVHVVLLNQALHALWRAGFFDATIAGTTLGAGVPQGTSIQVRTNLPPVLLLVSDKKVRLHLGAMQLGVIYPGLFEQPLQVMLGATADTSLTLQGDELQFGDIHIHEVFFSTQDGVTLDATTRDVLEDVLRSLLQNIINTSLNDALPALPIPSFALPPSVTQYGLPSGAELGILSPSLKNDTTHVTLDGSFGVR